MKKPAVLFFLFVLILSFSACRADAPGGESQLDRLYGFEGITQITLTNCHNGGKTFLTDEAAISEIAAFVGQTGIVPEGSGKGYYEGSYALEFRLENGRDFSLAFGDSDCLYTGKGTDGYPVRYLLTDRTVAGDVVPFFARYDESLQD